VRRAGSLVVVALVLALALPLALASGCGGSGAPHRVEVSEGIDHTDWNRLVHVYVNEKGLVDYAKWKASEADVRALTDYLAQFAPATHRLAVGAEKQAALTNGYNALVIRTILERYPTESIQSLSQAFTTRRHRIGGQDVSLDDIEHGTLRPEVGFRVHAALCGGARSSPPLAHDAYRSDRYVSQVSFSMLRWLARDDLNRFDLAGRRAEVSPVFKWYASDFDAAKGGFRGVLSTFAPDQYRAFVTDPSTKIAYLDYDWGLNDQGPHGRDYRRGLWQKLKGMLR
jgi:hypothetical protein